MEATKNILDFILEREASVIFTSSDLVYKGGRSYRHVEEDELNPTSFYGELKAKVEMDYHHAPGFYSFRLSNVISSNTKFLGDSLNRNKEYFSNLVRSPITASDLSRAVTHYYFNSERGNLPSILNLSGPEDLSRFEIARRTLGRKIEIQPLTYHADTEIGIPTCILTSSAKLSSILGDKLTKV